MSVFLVTGAAGFIGSAVAKELIGLGNKVVTVDNLSTGSKEAIPQEAMFIEGDCQDPKIIHSLERYKFDAILHIAGQSSGEVSFDDPVYDLQTNCQSTLLLLKLALKTECPKFIYASTMSVYGDQPDSAIAEQAFTFPKSLYGVGKLASEHYLRIYRQYGIQTSALRLFNVYGPGQNMKNLRQGMVSIYLAQAITNQRIIVKGSPERYRDFVYIDDVVDAFIKVLGTSTSNALNVCTGVRTTVNDLIGKICMEIGSDIPIEYLGSTPGDQFGIYGDSALIKNEVNWEAKTSLDIGLKQMVNWALMNRDWMN